MMKCFVLTILTDYGEVMYEFKAENYSAAEQYCQFIIADRFVTWSLTELY